MNTNTSGLVALVRSLQLALLGSSSDSQMLLGNSNIHPGLVVVYFVYLGFYVAFSPVQVISRRVVGRAEETSTQSSLGLCTVNCQPTASNYQLSHLSPCGDRTPGSEVGGESVTTLPPWPLVVV